GIRDDLVTGVQTCALPISCLRTYSPRKPFGAARLFFRHRNPPVCWAHSFGRSTITIVKRPAARTIPPTPVGAALVQPTVNVEVSGWCAPTEAAAVYSPFYHRTGPHSNRFSRRRSG